MQHELFVFLLIAGLLLTGAEIFVPGGLLGIMGITSFIGAMILSIIVFPKYGPYISLGLLFLLLISIYAWARFFPRTRMGKNMALQEDCADFDSTNSDLPDLLNQQGKATTDCRPAGFAVIGSRKIDVVTEGGMLSKGDKVKVVEVEGNRVVVRKI